MTELVQNKSLQLQEQLCYLVTVTRQHNIFIVCAVLRMHCMKSALEASI